jgi:hypothetical protein
MPRKKVKQPPPRKGTITSFVPPWSMALAAGDATAVLVLFGLGTFRSKGEGLAYPSQATLSTVTQLGERAQREALHRLVKAGAIYVRTPATTKKPAVYAIPDTPLGGSSTGPNECGAFAVDRHITPSRAAESADEVTTEVTTSSTKRSAVAVAVPAHAMRARAVDSATIYNSRRDPNHRPELRVVA